MAKYEVYLQTIASTVVTTEAEDGERAVELAFEREFPYAPAFAEYEFSEWRVPSEMFPEWNRPEDDYRLVED